jgi:hypothetical protein
VLANSGALLIGWRYQEEDVKVKERRKHKRASLEIPLDMRSPDGKHKSFTAKTINLSAGGFYCRVPFFVPMFTRLKISMVVPIKESGGRECDHVVACEGTVVRTVPDKAGPSVKSYEIGCFFTDMSTYDRLIVEQYLADKDL